MKELLCTHTEVSRVIDLKCGFSKWIQISTMTKGLLISKANFKVFVFLPYPLK